MPLYEIMSKRREEVLTCAKDRIRQQRPASPAVDADRDAKLPGLLDAVTTEMRHRSGATGQGPWGRRSKAAPKSEYSDIDELVQLYGSLCFSTLEVAGRTGMSISVRDHQDLNQSLDACIAKTVIQWEREKKDRCKEDGEVELVGFVDDDLRKAFGSRETSLQTIHTGRIPARRVTGEVLERNRLRLRAMLERLQSQTYLGAPNADRRDRLGVARLVQDSVDLVSAEALEKKVRLDIETDPALEMESEADLLASALARLLENAVKLTRPGGNVTVRYARSGRQRVTIEIEAECAGLPPGIGERLSVPLARGAGDTTGIAMARRVIEEHRGTLRMRELPGRCIFAVDVPVARAAGYAA